MILLFPTTALGERGATGATGATGAGMVTGMEVDYCIDAAPSGWVRKNGGTIGSASSGATERANADTADLYALLWGGYTNTECPVSGGRGVSAAADFAANKTLTLPDARGRVSVPAKTGTFATRGGTVGNETHTLTESELPAHTHSIDPLAATTAQNGSGVDVLNQAGVGSIATTSTGSGSAHNNIQPSLVTGCRLIKL